MATSYVWTTNRYPANWAEFAARNERINNPTQEPVMPPATDHVKQPEATPAFKAGDVVRLKCGGPVMVVNYIGELPYNSAVYCHWFNPNGIDICDRQFSPDVLCHYTGE